MKNIYKMALLGLFLIPSLSWASIDVDLRYGSRGQEVAELQEFLIDHSYLTGEATGNFYSLTRSAVKRFQTDNGIPSTGNVYALTRKAINDALAKEEDLSDIGSPAPTSTVQTSGDDLLKQILAEAKLQTAKLNQQINSYVAPTSTVVYIQVPQATSTPSTPKEVKKELQVYKFDSFQCSPSMYGCMYLKPKIIYREDNQAVNIDIKITLNGQSLGFDDETQKEKNFSQDSYYGITPFFIDFNYATSTWEEKSFTVSVGGLSKTKTEKELMLNI